MKVDGQVETPEWQITVQLQVQATDKELEDSEQAVILAEIAQNLAEALLISRGTYSPLKSLQNLNSNLIRLKETFRTFRTPKARPAEPEAEDQVGYLESVNFFEMLISDDDPFGLRNLQRPIRNDEELSGDGDISLPFDNQQK